MSGVRRALVPLAVLCLGIALCVWPKVRAEDLEPEWDSILILEQERDDPAPKKTTLRRKTRSRRSNLGYSELRKSWHAKPAESAFSDANVTSDQPLVLRTVGAGEPVILPCAQGLFDDAAISVASEAFGSWPSGPKVHPRLLSLIYRASRHFDVPYVHLISGIRHDRGGSRHSHGLAADVVLPGIADEDVAAFFRMQGFTGVGTYTRAGFVHIDVREQSYFWVDRSPPGKRWKVNQVRADEAKTADLEARARGEQAFEEPPALAQALEKRALRKRKHKGKSKGKGRASAKHASASR